MLLDQPFIKDAKLPVRDLVRDSIAKLGENIIIRRFARFEVGTANADRRPSRASCKDRVARGSVSRASLFTHTGEGWWRTSSSIASS